MLALEAEDFARSWLQAWNAHDVDAVLAHFADDCTFSSPLAATVAGAPNGVVSGRQALGDYWRRALSQRPELHFELLDVYVGSDSLVLRYRDQRGREACEVMVFDAAGKVTRAYACY